MEPRDVTERHRRAERRSCTRVRAAEDARLIVAGGVQARDRLATPVEHARAPVGREPGERADRTNAPAPLVGRYIVGGILGRLAERDVEFRTMEAVVAIEPGALRVRNVYAGRERTVEGFDSVALACGGVPDDALHRALKGRVPRLHVLGDAYAPRRIVFATRQAHALVQSWLADG
jgi:hypothetical protein